MYKCKLKFKETFCLCLFGQVKVTYKIVKYSRFRNLNYAIRHRQALSFSLAAGQIFIFVCAKFSFLLRAEFSFFFVVLQGHHRVLTQSLPIKHLMWMNS